MQNIKKTEQIKRNNTKSENRHVENDKIGKIKNIRKTKNKNVEIKKYKKKQKFGMQKMKKQKKQKRSETRNAEKDKIR